METDPIPYRYKKTAHHERLASFRTERDDLRNRRPGWFTKIWTAEELTHLSPVECEREITQIIREMAELGRRGSEALNGSYAPSLCWHTSSAAPTRDLVLLTESRRRPVRLGFF